MKVCQVIDQLQGGGQERVAVDLAIGLHEAGLASCLLATRRGGDYEQHLRKAGVPYLVMTRDRAGPSTEWIRAARWLREQGVDVLHAHSPASMVNCVGLRALLGSHARVGLHLQMLPPRGSRYRVNTVRWVRLLHRLLSHVVVTNEFLARVMTDRCGVPASKVHQIYNPVDFDRFASPERGGRSGPVNVVMVAQWRPQKDPLCAIDAIGLLRREGLEVTLRLVGALEDAGLVDQARERIERQNLGQAVEIAGRHDDMQKVLADADIGLLCTHFEGLPVSAIECAAAGLPLVVSRVPGTRELAKQFAAEGLFPVKRGNPRDVADNLRPLVLDRRYASRSGAKLREAVRQKADLPAVVRDLAGVLGSKEPL